MPGPIWWRRCGSSPSASWRAALLGALGLIAGLWAEKFDQMAAFQNFVIVPMTFLSGVFYSIHSLPAFWQRVSHLNPFFYMIDGFRYGFFGVSDVSPWTSLALVGTALVAVSALALHLLRTPDTRFETESAPNMTAEQLQHIIAAGLTCEHLEVTGDGRHWSAVIVSPEFEGKRPIARHQRVYATLGERMKTDEVHALSMKTFTPRRVGKTMTPLRRFASPPRGRHQPTGKAVLRWPWT